MRLPISFLYERYVYKVHKIELVNQEDPNVKKKFDIDDMFKYKDPRLRHLNENFKKEELHLDIIDFGGNDKEDYKHALDEIIKFNCFFM